VGHPELRQVRAEESGLRRRGRVAKLPSVLYTVTPALRRLRLFGKMRRVNTVN